MVGLPKYLLTLALFGVVGAVSHVPGKPFRSPVFVVGSPSARASNAPSQNPRSFVKIQSWVVTGIQRGGDQVGNNIDDGDSDTTRVGIIRHTAKSIQDVFRTVWLAIRGTLQFLWQATCWKGDDDDDDDRATIGELLTRFTFWVTQNYFHWYLSVHVPLRACTYLMNDASPENPTACRPLLNPMWLSTLGFDMLSVHMMIVGVRNISW